MITIPAIITEKGATPESVPNTRFGSYFDGTNYHYFETEDELIAWKLEQKNQPQMPVDDVFFRDENISKVWEVMINYLDKLPVELIDKLKSTLIK